MQRPLQTPHTVGALGLLALVLALGGSSACAISGGGGVGATIHEDGRPGMEVVGDDGAGMGFYGSNGDPSARVYLLPVFQLEASIGLDAASPHVPIRVLAVAQVILLPGANQPWGFHTGLAAGFELLSSTAIFEAFAGPMRMLGRPPSNGTAGDSGCLPLAQRKTQALDLSLRYEDRCDGAPCWEGLGAAVRYRLDYSVLIPGWCGGV
jgi:hypothetical protein